VNPQSRGSRYDRYAEPVKADTPNIRSGLMISPMHTVIRMEHATIESYYDNAETITLPVVPRERYMGSTSGSANRGEGVRSMPNPFADSGARKGSGQERVTVRVRDLAQGLRGMAAIQLAWLDDLGDDPVILTRDFYEVFLVCQQVRRAA